MTNTNTIRLSPNEMKSINQNKLIEIRKERIIKVREKEKYNARKIREKYYKNITAATTLKKASLHEKIENDKKNMLNSLRRQYISALKEMGKSCENATNLKEMNKIKAETNLLILNNLNKINNKRNNYHLLMKREEISKNNMKKQQLLINKQRLQEFENKQKEKISLNIEKYNKIKQMIQKSKMHDNIIRQNEKENIPIDSCEKRKKSIKIDYKKSRLHETKCIEVEKSESIPTYKKLILRHNTDHLNSLNIPKETETFLDNQVKNMEEIKQKNNDKEVRIQKRNKDALSTIYHDKINQKFLKELEELECHNIKKDHAYCYYFENLNKKNVTNLIDLEKDFEKFFLLDNRDNGSTSSENMRLMDEKSDISSVISIPLDLDENNSYDIYTC